MPSDHNPGGSCWGGSQKRKIGEEKNLQADCRLREEEWDEEGTIRSLLRRPGGG